MKKTYCDLCKKEIEFPKYKFLIRTDNGCTINSITSIMDGIEYDLCDECKEKIMTYVNEPTADVVEVVRCKDCIYKTVTKDGEYNPEDIVCEYHMSDGFDSDDYCSFGKRKVDE